MKKVRYTADALNDLRRCRSDAPAIIAKMARYAETVAGDVKALAGRAGARRLRLGDYRAVFGESDAEIVVTRVGHRRDVYD